MVNSLRKCPVCDEPRFEENEKTPRKVFKYLSVATRIARLFSDPVTSQLIQNHNSVPVDHMELSTIHSSPAWKEWYGEDGIFHGDRRAISFAICTDGLCPFAHEKNTYTMWPIFLIPLNLPHRLRSNSGSMMLTGIVPGPKEPEDLDPYLDLIVDDIHHLNKLKMHDGLNDEEFELQANILLHVFDYVGQTKVFKMHGELLMCILLVESAHAMRCVIEC